MRSRGMVHERIIGLYEENAAAWDELRQRLVEQDWLDRIVGLLMPGGSVLDIGCGTGKPVAAYLFEQGLRVTGVDSSVAMIAMCRENFPQAEWLVGDMRALALGRRFDAILAWHSFFHLSFDDQRAMFPRFAAHAEAGAILMFTSGPMHGEAIGEWQGEPLYHASLAPEEYRARLEENGFTILTHVIEDPECGHATIWIARYAGGKDCRKDPA